MYTLVQSCPFTHLLPLMTDWGVGDTAEATEHLPPIVILPLQAKQSLQKASPQKLTLVKFSEVRRKKKNPSQENLRGCESWGGERHVYCSKAGLNRQEKQEMKLLRKRRSWGVIRCFCLFARCFVFTSDTFCWDRPLLWVCPLCSGIVSIIFWWYLDDDHRCGGKAAL